MVQNSSLNGNLSPGGHPSSCSAGCDGSCSPTVSDSCNSPYYERSVSGSCTEEWEIVCGDGFCDAGEDCDSCSADCGTCGGGGGEEPIMTSDDDSGFEREPLGWVCEDTRTCSCQDQGLCEPCDPSKRNCANLNTDEAVGAENAQSGWCPTLSNPEQDGIDNDCDGATDLDDWDCPVDICDDVGVQGAPTDEGRDCLGYEFDKPGVEQTDGFYCDTNNGNKCCPVGEVWSTSTSSCELAPEGCNPSPCDKEPMTAAWWSDNNCITASQGCCYDSIVAGEPYYEEKANVAY